MAASGASGYVFDDSGTKSSAIAETPVTQDHSQPATFAETQPASSRTDQNIISTTRQTIPPHTDINHSDPTPGLIETYTDSVNRKVSEINEEFGRSFAPDSHDLALRDHEVKGEAQKQPILESGAQVRDLGWHKNITDMPGTLIGGVTNEELFAMIRRFNKVGHQSPSHIVQVNTFA